MAGRAPLRAEDEGGRCRGPARAMDARRGYSPHARTAWYWLFEQDPFLGYRGRPHATAWIDPPGLPRQLPEILNYGQAVGMVVAESFEAARAAAPTRDATRIPRERRLSPSVRSTSNRAARRARTAS